MFMKNSLLHLLIIVLINLLVSPIVLHAQVIQTGQNNGSVNYERLAKIDELVNDYINKNWVKGVVTIMIKDNQLIQYKGYGYADALSKTPMQKDELFRIASQTKAITCIGIMILYEQGKLMLDEPVADFIPEFKNAIVLDKFNPEDSTYTTVAAKRNIKIRDLLTHTSGLDYPVIGSKSMQAIYAKAGIPPGFDLGKTDQTLLRTMKLVAKLPLAHQPGEKWTYGLNYDLLGCLIEVISHSSLDEFFRKNIFEPLGMKDTYFNVPQSKASRLATVYTEDSLHHIIKWHKGHLNIDPDYPLTNKQYFSGGADLTSTAFDYAIFLQMLLNGGKYNGHEILSHRTVDMILSKQLDYAFDGVNNFGLGFEIVSDKGASNGPRSKGSFAWGGFFGTTYWADPKEHLVALILTQQTPNTHGDLVTKFEAMVYASLK
jgi:CubicO group peptidase (beta-lactamase class C family)